MSTNKKDNILYTKILSAIVLAIITSVGMCYCFRQANIFPFGENSNLFSDLSTQYVSFLVFFRESTFAQKIFSLTKGFGGQTLGLLSYYAFSPFNFIAYLFRPENIETALFVIIVVRAVFMAESMLCYLGRHYKNNILNIAFALMYAFFPYFTRYYYNILWMDCFALLPLIILGTERIMDGKSGKLFVFAYVYSLVSNYYIAYMSSLFVLLWFICRFVILNGVKIKAAFIQAMRMAKYAVISIMLSAPVLLPSFFLLAQGKFEDTTISSWRLIKNFNWGTFPASFFEGMMVHEYTPHFAGTIVCFFLLSAFFLNKDIGRRERIMSALLLGFMVASLTCRPLGYVWHGFSAPQGFHHRQTFTYAFTIIALCRKSAEHLESRSAFKALAILSLPFAFAMYYYTLDLAFTWRENILLPTVLTIAVCAVAFIGVRYSQKASLLLLGAYICFISIYLGAFHMRAQFTNDMAISAHSAAGDFRNDYLVTETALNAITDDGFYRMEDISPWSQNQAMVHGYSSISHYSSVFESFQKETAVYFGLPDTYYSTTYTQSLPLRDALFGIKYVMVTDPSAVSEYYTPVYTGEKSVYSNPFCLPVVYTGSTNSITQGENWKETVNNMAVAITGIAVLDENRETDYNQLAKAADVFKEKECTVTENNGMFLSFTTDKTDDTYMLTSLIYDEDWHVKVNGKSVQPEKYMNYFMSVPVEKETENTIQMAYIPKGLVPGLAVMSAAVIIMAAHYIIKRKSVSYEGEKIYVH